MAFPLTSSNFQYEIRLFVSGEAGQAVGVDVGVRVWVDVCEAVGEAVAVWVGVGQVGVPEPKG